MLNGTASLPLASNTYSPDSVSYVWSVFFVFAILSVDILMALSNRIGSSPALSRAHSLGVFVNQDRNKMRLL